LSRSDKFGAPLEPVECRHSAWPALRLCVIASLHRALLQHLEPDPDDGLPAPSCIRTFAELAARHCMAR
jgi:hypothetical protein